MDALEKLEDVFLVTLQRCLSEFEVDKLAHHRLMIVCLARLSILFEQFRAWIKEAWVCGVRSACIVRYALSLSAIASEQERSNQMSTG